MLSKNILKINKIVSLLCIIFLLSSLIVISSPVETKATYDSKFKNYPGYEELLKKLQTAHPKWKFELLDTGLNWYDAIIAESTGRHGLNVVPKEDGSAWKCSCGKVVDAKWVCASTAAVAFYMDPRNSLNEDYIFQFEKLTFDNQTEEGVKTIIGDCDYLQGKIKYLDSKGEEKTINKTYSQVIMEAAKKYKVSPYHLASRIRQEQGTGSGSIMIKGTYKGYEGLYNYFNIGAFGKTNDDIITKGLKKAKNNGWTDPEKAIMGGTSILVSSYIARGQDTLYLEKFDVIEDDGYYSWQYMTNVSASKTEGEKIRQAYRNMGMITKDSEMTFKIPVYKNMPEMQAPRPGSEQIVTQDVQITADKVDVKEGKGTSYKTITTLKKNEKLLRIELDNVKDSNGKYWDKVVLKDGKKGYIMRDYLKQLSLQTNSDDKYVVIAYTNFRNGPGVTGTNIIKLLSPGQMLTVVEKDVYKSVDKEDWYRVKLADGTYGYVGTGYIEPYNANNGTIDRVEVVCTDGLNVRKEPSTNSTVLKSLNEGTILTRTEKNVKSAQTEYIWDKITTSSGIVGYVVRQDPKTKKEWIKPIAEPNTEEPKEEPKEDQKEEPKEDNNETDKTIKDTKDLKVDKNNLISKPDMTIENIKKQYKDAVIKDGNEVKTKGNIATGWTITVNNKTYTIVVKGDTNGDGQIKATDYMRIKNYIMDSSKLTDAQKSAADVNKDGQIKATDYMKIKNYIMGTSNIEI